MSIHQLHQPEAIRYYCPKCGVDAACDCGVAPIARAETYAAANPTASVREIAAATGAGRGTAHRAKAAVVPSGTITLGLGGKPYPAFRPAPPDHDDEDTGLPEAEEELVALACYHWSKFCEHYRAMSPAAKAEFESDHEPPPPGVKL